jgi:serine/threonine protein kinase
MTRSSSPYSVTRDQSAPVQQGAATPNIAGWNIVRKLGGGAFTTVYQARPRGAPASQFAGYAIKMLAREHQNTPGVLTRFRQEARASRKVDSAHVVPVLNASLQEAPYFLVTPFLEGASLDTLLSSGISASLPVVLWIMRQAAQGLDALFTAGWMHGDLKPQNVIISPTCHVTLIDLGFARPLDSNEATYRLERPSLVGTPSYMAPELLTSNMLPDIRSDIYSLGVILFEMLTGRLPFDARDPGRLAQQHREQPPDLKLICPHLPKRVRRLVYAILAKEPLRRPQTPAELVDRLAALEIETFAERLAG